MLPGDGEHWAPNNTTENLEQKKITSGPSNNTNSSGPNQLKVEVIIEADA